MEPCVTIINPGPAEFINAQYPFLKTWSINLDNSINLLPMI